MIRIVVSKSTLREVPYTDKKGAAQKLLIQEAHAFTHDEHGAVVTFPDKFEIVLPRGQMAGYAPGEYTLHPSAVYVDRDGRLACTPRLAPLKQATRATA